MEHVIHYMILLLAITVHEVSHGYMAFRLGDDTASLSGRLTLNPIAHVDPIGTILVPLSLFMMTRNFASGPIVFGWAKPVPVNPLRFRRDITMRNGMSLVAASGPLANIVLALLFAGVVHGCGTLSGSLAEGLCMISIHAVMVNLFLAFFNFIPIPPLDGSKVLLHFLSPNFAHAILRLEPYGFILVIMLFNYTPLGSLIALLTWVVAKVILGGAV